MPRLVAVQRFYFSGRNREAGEVFEATEEYGRLLKGWNKARDATPADEAAASGAEADEPRTGRGRYKRRDMRAED